MKSSLLRDWLEAVEVHMNAAKMGGKKHRFFGRWWWGLYHELKKQED